MALAVDATSSSFTTNAASAAHNHTVAGSNRILVVLIATWDEANDTDGVVTSVTYNGVALTKVRDDNIATHERTEIWYLIAPATGTNSIAVTTTAQVNGIDIHAISLTDARQSGQPDAQQGAELTSTDPSTVDVTTASDNCWVIGISASNINAAQVEGAGQTQIGSTNTGYTVSSYEGPKTPAGAVTHSYSNGGADNFAISAISVAPTQTDNAIRKSAGHVT